MFQTLFQISDRLFPMLVFGAAFFRIAASRETNSGSCNHSLGTDRAKVNAIFNPQKKFLGSGKFFSRTFAARCDDAMT